MTDVIPALKPGNPSRVGLSEITVGHVLTTGFRVATLCLG